MMRYAGLLIAAAAAFSASSARSEVLFANGFDAENGGTPVSGYTSFDGLTVARGPINLIGSGSLGVTCVGGTGQCVELFGARSSVGSLVSSRSYSFAAGDTITFSFDISGNQRNRFADDFFAAVDFLNGPTLLTAYGVNGNNSGPSSRSQIAILQGLVGNDPFSTRSIYFTAAEAGALSFFVGAGYDPAGGVIVDNLRLERQTAGAPVAPVPEPSTWAQMLAGLGMVGYGMRRRKRLQFGVA